MEDCAAQAALDTGTPNSPHSPAWSKQLYLKRDGVADNNVDPSFLAALKEASSCPPRPKLASLIKSTVSATTPLSSTFFLLAVFMNLLRGDLAPGTVIWVALGSVLAGYVANALVSGEVHPGRQSLRPSLITLVLLHSLSPILRTLTAATTSDSIWPIAGALLLLGLILGDYQKARSEEKSLTSSLSLTSTLSGSVVLASRLHTNAHVFAFILFSIFAFALAPRVWRRLGHLEPGLSLSTFSITAVCLWRTSAVAAAIFLAAFLVVAVGGPWLMVTAWSHKTVIRGQWDVARPKPYKAAERSRDF